METSVESGALSTKFTSELASEGLLMLVEIEGVVFRAIVRVRQMCLMSFSSNSLHKGIIVSREYDQSTRDRSSR